MLEKKDNKRIKLLREQEKFQHETVDSFNPFTQKICEIDKKLELVISSLWWLGYETDFCCEGHPTESKFPYKQGYISFKTLDTALRVLQIIAPALYSAQIDPRDVIVAFRIEAASHGRGILRFPHELIPYIETALDAECNLRALVPGEVEEKSLCASCKLSDAYQESAEKPKSKYRSPTFIMDEDDKPAITLYNPFY